MNKLKQVDNYLKNNDHPLLEEIQMIRNIILNASPKMRESIKWAAPTFVYRGNMATFNMRATKFINLTFHNGALINDKTGLLEGDQKQARVSRFYGKDDIENKRDSLTKVVRNWVAIMDCK